MKNHSIIPSLLGLCLLFLLANCKAQSSLVKNLDEFNSAVKAAQAGDKIILANGVWKDVELVFTGKGTAAKPITLGVQEKGKVTLEGQSNLSIAGEYLVVEGLVFKNGYTPTNEVISYKTDEKSLCNHCRITECVVDNFSNPERFESDYWVGIYGKNNRFDHNYLTGKRNQGVTLAVRLTSEESRENHHQIDHNYFGHRPVLGSNGGETLRIGTSHFSMSNSNTVVEFNYFDRCNGEHEIISNKSCQNVFRYNTFNECQGTLTMRHGNETLVESNYFFGNGKPNTGGIRIINEKQKVINNYCEGLTGYRFRGALVIMNGVPNSTLNRYFQVKDSEASNNTFVNCDYIQLCAGSDAERSAVPVNSVVNNNIFYNEKKAELFTVYDDISGISFSKNLLSPNIEPITPQGFKKEKLSFKRDKNGILMPEGKAAKGIGILDVKPHATPENTGVTWYPIVEEEVHFKTGRVVRVEPGINTIFEAAKSAKRGDILELGEGAYILTKAVDLTQPLTIRAASGLKEKPIVTYQKTSLFNIENGGSLELQGLIVDGKDAPDAPGNVVIRTSRYSMNRNYKLFIEDCDFRDLDVNHSFDVVKVFKNTCADSILLRNSSFQTVSGDVLSLDKETDDYGIYNAENVVVENCLFADIEGVALNLYRGGSDESTFGPMLWINHCVFDKVGEGKRNKLQAAIRLHGVQLAMIRNSIFSNSEPVQLFLAVGDPVIQFSHCNFYKAGEITSNDPAYEVLNLTKLEPGFAAQPKYVLSGGSPLIGKGDDGQNLGILR